MTDPLAARLSVLQGRARPGVIDRPGLGELALRLAQDAPDRVVLRDGAQVLTRGALVDQALRLGRALQARGLRRGASVALQLPNWWEATVINMACALFGWRIVPLLPIYRAAELGAILPAAKVEALFIPAATDKVDYPAIIAGLDPVPDQVIVVRGGANSPEFETMLRHDHGDPAPGRGAEAKLIIYTSGSTGRPKGVVHSHGSLDAVVRRSAAFWGLGPDDVLYVPSPIGHIGGSLYAFEFPWLTGCQTILTDTWDPDRAVEEIDAQGVSFMAGATPFLTGLTEAAARAGSSLPSLKRFICGGASVPPDLIRRALAQFPQAVVSRAYGSSEVPLAFPGIRDRASALARAETDGESDVDVRVTPDAEGEIAVRGDQMFLGYLDPRDDDGAFDGDGYFQMGDLGRLIDDRFIVITGRTKDIIIRKGENISPQEIETALLRHAAIAQVGIVGAPDPERGEMLVAFVVLSGEETFDMESMARHLSDQGLARQKCPERLEIVRSLPMNAVGKVQKPELRRIAAATQACWQAAQG